MKIPFCGGNEVCGLKKFHTFIQKISCAIKFDAFCQILGMEINESRFQSSLTSYLSI